MTRLLYFLGALTYGVACVPLAVAVLALLRIEVTWLSLAIAVTRPVVIGVSLLAQIWPGRSRE